VTFGEPHAAGGQAVDIRRLIKSSRIIGADIHEAHVIGEKEDDIGLHVFDRAQGDCAYGKC
jgi:hypothetical protein